MGDIGREIFHSRNVVNGFSTIGKSSSTRIATAVKYLMANEAAQIEAHRWGIGNGANQIIRYATAELFLRLRTNILILVLRMIMFDISG